MNINTNHIDFRGPLVNGPGIRAVINLQGGYVHCAGCHNESTWDFTTVTIMSLQELADQLIEKCRNRKITISGSPGVPRVSDSQLKNQDQLPNQVDS